MKKLFNLIIMLLLVSSVFSQPQITLTFLAKDSITQNPLRLDSVHVMNLTENCDTALYDSISVLTMNANWPVGMKEPTSGNSVSFILMQNVPNPFRGSTHIRIYMKNKGELNLAVYDNQGKKLSDFHNVFSKGWHLFGISTKRSQQLLLHVSDDKITKTIKILNTVAGNDGERISYQGSSGNNLTTLRSLPEAEGFIFYLGNQLQYTAYVEGFPKRILLDNPVSSETYTFTMLAFTCGDSITINHVAGDVAPVDKTTTYGTVTNIPGLPSKCWITSNLGSDHQATSVDDATEASAGWYWQFNRKQGYKHDGTTRTPNTTWITPIVENSNWIAANDPCNIELGSTWRIPTKTEWYNIDNINGWTDWTGPWNSGLKLHAAGNLGISYGYLFTRGESGNYHSSTQSSTSTSWYLDFGAWYSNMWDNDGKAYAWSIRCLRDF